MKLQYLGTAAAEGWPCVWCNCEFCQKARKLGGRNIRTRSQAIVDDELLLDFPCDTWLHALRENLDLSAVRWLFVTHSHTDHIYPAELVNRGGEYAHGMKSPDLEIFCNQAVKDYLFRAAGQELEPEVRELLHIHVAEPFVPIQAGPYTVMPLPAKHMRTEQALIYLIEKEGKSLLYAHDTGRFYPEVYEFLEKRGRPIDLISLDCTSGCYCNGDRSGHMGFPDTVIVREKLLKLGAADGHTRFILNHFSHNGKWLYDEISARAEAAHMTAAYDGMTSDF